MTEIKTEAARSAFYAESIAAAELLPATQAVAIDSFMRALARLQSPSGLSLQDELVEALEPFAAFAEHMVDAEGWTSIEHCASISTWFGPSDFRRARSLLTRIKSERDRA